ncbi:MAG TPA: hypothetical protein DEQ47_04095 [Solibacterales bacterium]|nr:hypothetical protein [Bryobacterales bacterium]
MRALTHIWDRRIALLLLADLALVLAVFLGVSWGYYGRGDLDFLVNYDGLERILVVVVSVVLGLYLSGLYTQLRVTSRVSLAMQLFSVFGITLIIQGMLSYSIKTISRGGYGLHLPRIFMMSGVAACFAAVFTWRLFYGSVLFRRMDSEGILFLGSDGVVCEIAERMAQQPESGFRVVGYLAPEPAPHACEALGRHLGTPADVSRALAETRASRIVAGMMDRRHQLPMDVLLDLSRDGFPIEDAAATYERVCGRFCSRDFRPSQFIFDRGLVSRPGSMAMQSIYTNVVALISIIATLPLMLLIGLAVKLSSRGPALIVETRLGQHAVPFSINRFRIWRQVDGVEGFSRPMTAVGRFLNRFHLDRLPLLFNVLRGELALVGPTPDRPEFAAEVSRYVPFYPQRQMVKPGLTGWSQINALRRTAPDALTALEYDLYYTKHLSVSLDAYILLSRMRQILTGV